MYAAEAMLDANVIAVLQTPVAGLKCPSDAAKDLNDAGGEYRPADTNGTQYSVAYASYAGVCDGNGSSVDNRQYNCQGVLYVDSDTKFRDVTDGTSNVLMVGEKCRERYHARCERMQNTGGALAFVMATSILESHDNRGHSSCSGNRGPGN